MRYFFIFFSLLICSARAQQSAAWLARLNQSPEEEKIKLYNQLSKAYAQNQPDSAVHYANASPQAG